MILVTPSGRKKLFHGVSVCSLEGVTGGGDYFFHGNHVLVQSRFNHPMSVSSTHQTLIKLVARVLFLLYDVCPTVDRKGTTIQKLRLLADIN